MGAVDRAARGRGYVYLGLIVVAVASACERAAPPTVARNSAPVAWRAELDRVTIGNETRPTLALRERLRALGYVE